MSFEGPFEPKLLWFCDAQKGDPVSTSYSPFGGQTRDKTSVMPVLVLMVALLLDQGD